MIGLEKKDGRLVWKRKMADFLVMKGLIPGQTGLSTFIEKINYVLIICFFVL